jgi:hypothetical protein
MDPRQEKLFLLLGFASRGRSRGVANNRHGLVAKFNQKRNDGK